MSNEIATVSAPTNAVQMLAEGKQTVFTTIKGDDVDSRLALFAAVTDSVALDDHRDKPIALANIVVQSIEMIEQDANGNPVVNPSTGEASTVEVPRTILIDTEGVAYHAVSKGLFRSIENLVGLLGSDPAKWTNSKGEPLKVVVSQEGTGNRKYFTMRPVKSDSKASK